MLSKTHLVCGMAASLAILQPRTPGGIAVALIGGAIGGSIPDIDIIKNRTNLDSIITQGVAAAIAAAVIFCDYYFNYGILRYMKNNPGSVLTGAAVYAALMVIGFYAPHRGFTHSILAMLLFTTAVRIIYPDAAQAYLFGYGSHLVLDLLNRRPVELFFPVRKGICLKMCYSNRRANHLFFMAGSIVTVCMLVLSAGRAVM